jgi:arsenite methyltransferase
MRVNMINIYESSIFTQLPDGSMHPGGLRLTNRAVRLAALKADMHVADIGCGTGVTAAFLTDKYKLTVVGLEISGALIDIGLKNNPGLHLIRWNCETFPFEDESLDAIFFECTLSVIGNIQSVLSQCAKALKAAGAIIISDVCSRQSDSEKIKTAKNTPPTSVMMQEMLSRSGFDVVLAEDHTPALRTFLAQLREQNGSNLDTCAFFGACGAQPGARLSDFGYSLIIARKI